MLFAFKKSFVMMDKSANSIIFTQQKSYTMKKLLSFILALTIITTLNSCGGKKEEAAVVAPAGMITLDLSKYGKPFTIFVPDSSAGKIEIIEQTWGALEIKSGKNFQISITEDPG